MWSVWRRRRLASQASRMCRADSLESLGQLPATSPYTSLGEPAAQDLLGLASSVAVGRVEEVDPFLERPVHDGEAVGFICLRTEVHRAETQRADEEPGSSEMA